MKKYEKEKNIKSYLKTALKVFSITAIVLIVLVVSILYERRKFTIIYEYDGESILKTWWNINMPSAILFLALVSIFLIIKGIAIIYDYFKRK